MFTTPMIAAPPAKGPAEFFAQHSAAPSPTVEHVAFAHHHHPHHLGRGHGQDVRHPGDMELDYTFGGITMAGMGVLSGGLHHAGGASSSSSSSPANGMSGTVSADMMAFGVPELGVGYGFDPQAHAQVALEFSAEELAIMDQIVRQQQGGGAGGAVQGLYAIGQQVG